MHRTSSLQVMTGQAGCVLLCRAVLCPADPLVMDNGQDLVTMCCHAYESPDGADEEEELVDYCE